MGNPGTCSTDKTGVTVVPAQQDVVASLMVLFPVPRGIMLPTAFTTGSVFLINFHSFPPGVCVCFIADVEYI